MSSNLYFNCELSQVSQVNASKNSRNIDLIIYH